MVTRITAEHARDAIPPLAPSHPLDLLDTPVASAKMQRDFRLAHEAQFPWYARLLRRLSRFPHSLYEFADSVDKRLKEIHRDQRDQSRAIDDVTTSITRLATQLNRVLGEFDRMHYYEQHVPAIRRAKAEYDLAETQRRQATEATAAR